MTINQVAKIMDELIPLGQAEGYDNVGLLCGRPENTVTGILVCHDVLEAVVDEAINKEVNLIVCFHPIIFKGLKKITGADYVQRSVLKAIENKIAIYAIHTAFDNDFFGVNHRICEKLGLENKKVLMPKKGDLHILQVYVPTDHEAKVQSALFNAGAGNIGFYDECSFSLAGKGTFRPKPGADPYDGEIGKRETTDEKLLSVIFEKRKQAAVVAAMQSAHPYEEVAYQTIAVENENQYEGLGMYGEFDDEMSEQDFLILLREKFGLEVVRHSNFINRKIKRVAVLGGSGADGISAAKSKNCDAYITGDLKYHDFFRAESQILLCDVGHFESEQFVTEHLVEILSQKFTTFAVSKSVEKTNPVNYFL